MGLADEGHHVVLAMRIEGDVADEHHVVVAVDILEGAVERFLGGLAVAGVEFLVGLGDALRRVRRPSRTGLSPAQRSGCERRSRPPRGSAA